MPVTRLVYVLSRTITPAIRLCLRLDSDHNACHTSTYVLPQTITPAIRLCLRLDSDNNACHTPCLTSWFDTRLVLRLDSDNNTFHTSVLRLDSDTNACHTSVLTSWLRQERLSYVCAYVFNRRNTYIIRRLATRLDTRVVAPLFMQRRRSAAQRNCISISFFLVKQCCIGARLHQHPPREASGFVEVEDGEKHEVWKWKRSRKKKRSRKEQRSRPT
jgi:hypothetical protein